MSRRSVPWKHAGQREHLGSITTVVVGSIVGM